MSFEMVAMDRDRTILNKEGRIHSLLLKLLKDVTDKGKYVIIATGGSKEGVKRVFAQNGYKAGSKGYPQVIIAANHIFYLKDNKYLPDKEWNNNVEKWTKETKSIVTQITDKIISIIQEDIEFKRKRYCTLKFKEVKEAQRMETIANKYIEKQGLASKIMIERNITGFSLVDSRKGKGNCLLHVAKKLGFSPEEIVTIGDSGNDKSMLDASKGFLPACPENAEEVIKKIVEENNGIVASYKYGRGVAEIIKMTLIVEEIIRNVSYN